MDETYILPLESELTVKTSKKFFKFSLFWKVFRSMEYLWLKYMALFFERKSFMCSVILEYILEKRLDWVRLDLPSGT